MGWERNELGLERMDWDGRGWIGIGKDGLRWERNRLGRDGGIGTGEDGLGCERMDWDVRGLIGM